jgi:hypothetical protein
MLCSKWRKARRNGPHLSFYRPFWFSLRLQVKSAAARERQLPKTPNARENSSPSDEFDAAPE